ncbi:hypothetical protein L6164_009784 [Bauhinia variegata]|uniref:Uncharacterized protein n=1 Tax=Bauhinia variegata TaxID=167791 RepID=A0ACB9PK67_BAUVA|nr:hypothetical protein L6164_009784 [Bauhinia variegata]
MASRKGFLSKPSYIFPTTSDAHFSPESTEGAVEFEEADVWNFPSNADANTVTETKKTVQSFRPGLKRGSKKVDVGGKVNPVASASSLPVNIPDWSQILKEDYKGHQRRNSDDEVDEERGDGDNNQGIRIPPHEYLARTRGASFSVHEGRGRTLKGRDLRRVRNAIWKKVGFED